MHKPCWALAGQRVRRERIEGKVLVSYRHMYLREIDPARGWTRPLWWDTKRGLRPLGRGPLRSPSPSHGPRKETEV